MSRLKEVMTKKEFRPRPIDVNQPLPIISDERLLDEIEKDNTVTIINTNHIPSRPKNKRAANTVHTPLYREVDDYKAPQNSIRFARPQGYILNQRDELDDLELDDVEYELDPSDERFLAALNNRIKSRAQSSRQLRSRSSTSTPSPSPSPTPSPSRGRNNRESVATNGITEDMLEQLINGLEKEAFYVYGLHRMRDNTMDGMLCCVCNDNQDSEEDQLIVCDGCNMAAHQHCYGIHDRPVATWLCDHCLAREENATCVLCAGRYGGLKPTTDGKWVHVLCALWFPEVSFKDPYLRDPISGIENIQADRWNKKCSLCNDTRGVCIHCDEVGCKELFHVGCARARGLFVEIRTDSDRLVLTAYCTQHSLHRLEHYPSFPRDNEHSLGNETAVLAKSMGISEEVYDLIYSYWRVKRRGHPPPLLRRLRTLISEGCPVRLGNASASMEYHAKFVKLRQDFERARMLVDLVRKRELARRQLLDSLKSLVHYYSPQNGTTGDHDEDEEDEEDENNDDEEEEEPDEEDKKETITHHYPKRQRH